MSDEHEPAAKHKPPVAVPLTLIALGATAVVVPIILLRRTRGAVSRSVKELHDAPPPIRRVPRSTSHSGSSSAAECIPPWPHIKSQAKVESATESVGVQSVSSLSRTTGPFFALKALGIATCIVGASAVTSVFAVRWAMGVQSAEEFAARVRSGIQSLTPMLSSRIYKHHSEFTVEMEGRESEEWTWADANERLSKAYEEGGLAQWMKVAEKELELEVNNEQRRRAQHEGRTIGT